MAQDWLPKGRLYFGISTILEITGKVSDSNKFTAYLLIALADIHMALRLSEMAQDKLQQVWA